MKYIVSLILLLVGYYTFSYGLFQWKSEKNKLGALATVVLAIVGTIVPIVFLIIRAL